MRVMPRDVAVCGGGYRRGSQAALMLGGHTMPSARAYHRSSPLVAGATLVLPGDVALRRPAAG
jgi:hypothetical protein